MVIFCSSIIVQLSRMSKICREKQTGFPQWPPAHFEVNNYTVMCNLLQFSFVKIDFIEMESEKASFQDLVSKLRCQYHASFNI